MMFSIESFSIWCNYWQIKKKQFGNEISCDTGKFLFENTIWNPDHPRLITKINRSQNEFVGPSIENLSIGRVSIGRV